MWWWVVLVAAVAGSGRRAPVPRWREWRDVATAQGAVRGYLGARHFAFLGIPYASPPTRADRFKAPEPAARWSGIFEATHRVRCPQGAGAGDENCLVVNVFVPRAAQECCPLPVLAHVHDGSFHSGWGSVQPPAHLDDFIIVTFNYRLGALGFLCLGTPEAPGNAGLKDQVAALYWIQENIASFRGNPSDVTLYGTGSGATSVQLLILSGAIKGLVNRVIIESGSVLSPVSMMHDPLATAINTAKTIGYNDDGDLQELIKFYRRLPVKEIVKVTTNFLPCVESKHLYAQSMIDVDPFTVLKEARFEKLPMMIIYTNANELPLIEQHQDKFTTVPEFFEDLLPTNLAFEDEDTRYRIADLVRDFYFDDMTENLVVQNYKDYINDIFLEYPMYKFAILYASKTSIPVFLMRYMYDAKNNGDNGGKYGDIFKYVFLKDELKANEQEISEKLMSMFINFMKIGDPTPLTSELVPEVWQPLNPKALDIGDIGQPCLLFRSILAMGTPPSSERLTFWDHIYNKYYRKHIFDGD